MNSGTKKNRFNAREIVSSLRKILFSREPLVLLAAASPALVMAGPNGGQVVHGDIAITNPNNVTTQIEQSTQKGIINWQGFSIAGEEFVQFKQPGSSSITLNRVVGGKPSAILGNLSANGQVFLVNSQGVYFGKNAQVDVGGLVASTLDIRDQDFINGDYKFTIDSNAPADAAVINEGILRAREGGYIVLAGNYTENTKIIQAKLGTVALAAGSQLTLDIEGNGLISVAVDEAVMTDLAGVKNTGELMADGGRVIMTAKVLGDLLSAAVNNEGLVQARGIEEHDGSVYLMGDKGIALSSGAIDVSSADTGGTVQITGNRVGLHGDASINASGSTGGGTILIGGDYQGNNTDVANAARTFVGGDATIKADATVAGDGGKVIVWSDEVTRYNGTISVKGGEQTGDGGFVEVSGKQSLDFAGQVDAGATNGIQGSLLLDPTEVFVVGGADGSGDQDAVTTGSAPQLSFADPNTTNNEVSVGRLQALGNVDIELQGTSRVVVGGSGGTATDLDLSATLTSATLTLTGGNGTGLGDVIFNPGSAVTTGGGNVVINAGTAGDTSGKASLMAITTNSGNVTVNALGAVDATLAVATGGGNFTSSGTTFNNTAGSATISTGGGNIDLNGHTGAVTVGNTINTGGGSFSATNVDSFAINTAINALGNTVNVSATNAITHTVGIVSGTTVTLDGGTGTGTLVNPVSVNATTAVNSTSGGDIHLTDSSGGMILGTIDAGANTASIIAPGAISQTGAVNAGVLKTSSVGGTVLTNANTVEAVDATNTTSGTVQLNNTSTTSLDIQGINQTGGANVTIIEANAIGLSGSTAAGGNTISLTAGTSINGGGTISTATVDLNATTGIGETTALSLNVTAISADTTNGDIDLDNNNSSDVTVSSLTTTSDSDNSHTGTIDFDQTGGGAVSFNTVDSFEDSIPIFGENHITLKNTGADLTVAGSSILAEGLGNVTLQTNTSGNIILTGSTTADGSAAFIYSAGSINGAGVVTANSIELLAVTGIGNTTALNLASATSIDAVTTDGDVNINHDATNSSGNVGLYVTTGSGGGGGSGSGGGAGGNITFDQTATAGSGSGSGVGLDIEFIGAENGDVTITNSGGMYAGAYIQQIVALSTGNEVNITTDGAITAGSVSSGSGGGGAFGFANILADTIDLTAMYGGIGELYEEEGSGPVIVQTGANTLYADTSNDGSDIIIGAIGDTVVGTVTAGSGNVLLGVFHGDLTSGSVDGSADIIGSTIAVGILGSGCGCGSGSGTIGTSISDRLEVDADVLYASTPGNPGDDIFLHDTDGGVAIGNGSSGGLGGGGPGGLSTSNGFIDLLVTSGDLTSDTVDGTADVVADKIVLTVEGGAIGNGGGNLEVSATSQLDADTTDDDGNITIDSIGDLPLGLIDAGTGIITLASTGNISDVNDVEGPENNITGSSAALIAETGIGTYGGGSGSGGGGALETAVGTLAASNTTSGDIEIDNSVGGLLVIGSVNGTAGVSNSVGSGSGGGSAGITITNASPITVSNPISNSTGGSILVAAEGSATTDDLVVNANITATNGAGDIDLFAGDTITVGATETVSAESTGDILISAGTDYNGGGGLGNGNAGGAVVLSSGSKIYTEDGNITIRAPQSVTLSDVNADSNALSTAGVVTVIADYDGVDTGLSDNVGAIIDGNGVADNVTGSAAEFLAATGIGDSDAIEVCLGSLAANNTTSGDINITNATGKTLTLSAVGGTIGVSNSGGGTINLVSDALDIIATLDAGTGAIVLAPSDDATPIEIGAGATDSLAPPPGVLGLSDTELAFVKTATGLTIGNSTNDGGITVVGALDLVTPGNLTGGKLTLQQDAGDINVNGTLTSPRNTDVITASGNINFGLAGNITATGNTVDLTATGGAITGHGTPFTNVTADALVARAANGIGSSNAIETSINTLAATNSTAGGIGFENSNAGAELFIGSVDGTAGITNSGSGGAITVTNNSPMTVSNDVINNSGMDITLTATNDGGNDDDITVNARIIASGGAGDILLDAGTDIIVNGPASGSGGGGAAPQIHNMGTGGIELRAFRHIFLNVGTELRNAGDETKLTANNVGSASGSGGAITMHDTALVDGGTGTVALQADGDIKLGGITTTNITNTAVSITSDSGAVLDNGDTRVDVIARAGRLVIDAATGVGSSGAFGELDTEVKSFDVDVTGPTGNIDIDNVATSTGPVNVANMTTTDGDIDFDQTGNESLTLTTVTTGDGNVTVTNTGGTGADVLIGSISTDKINDIVDITSTGAIDDLAPNPDLTVDIATFDVDLNAAEGIGATAHLETMAKMIDADTTTGDIDIDNLTGGTTGPVTVGTMTTGSGDIDFDQTGNESLTLTTVSTDGIVTITNTGGTDADILIGTITTDKINDLVDITSTGAIDDLAPNPDLTVDIISLDVDLNAVEGIGATAHLETMAKIIDADTTTGDIDIDNLTGGATGEVMVGTMTTGAGDIDFDQTGNESLALMVISTGDGNVTVTNTGGTMADIKVGSISTDKVNDIVDLTSTGAIDDLAANPDLVVDIATFDVDLNAAEGIGATAHLETMAKTIDADTTTGDIDIDNLTGGTTGPVTVGTMTTGSGDIDFDQTGNESLTLTTVTTGDGNVTVTNTGGTGADVLIGSISTDKVNDIVDITSTGAIDDLAPNPDLTVDIATFDVDLNAAEGIGATAHIETMAKMIDADTTAGDIDIDNLTGGTTGPVTVGTMTTGSGDIDFDQTGNESLTLTTVTTGDGDITITNSGGSGADIDIVLVMADLIDDTVTITADGAINSVTDDGTADVIGETVNLIAKSGGIGTTSVLDVTAGSATLNADTTADGSDIFIDHIGDAQVGLITTGGAGDVTLDSTGDIDSETDDGVADIVAATANLIAASGGVGNGSILDVTVGTALNVDTTADGGNVFVDSIGELPVGLVDADSGGAKGNVTLDSTAGINDATVDTVVDIRATIIDLDAFSGIGNTAALEFDTGSVSADTTTGAIDIDNTGNQSLTLTSITTGDGNITIDNLGGTDADVLVGVMTADKIDDVIKLTADGAINDEAANPDTTIDIASFGIDLDAVEEIGGSAHVDLMGTSIAADSGGGNIDLNNMTAGPATVTSLTTSGGSTITFNQSGGGSVTFDNVTTTPDGSPTAGEDDIVLRNTGGDLNISGAGTGVTAGGEGTILLETVTTGDINLTGTTTAAGNLVKVSAFAEINGGGLITGTPVNLMANTGIGGNILVNTSTDTVEAMTTTGDIDVTNAAPGSVDVVNISTGGGTINYNQTGGEQVTLGAVSSADGNITINNDAAVLLGLVTADKIDDVVSVTGTTINDESANPDMIVDIAAFGIDLNATGEIGGTAHVDLMGTSISADTGSGNIDLKNINTVDSTVTSLTTASSGTILFEQSDGGSVTFDSVMTDADVVLRNTGGNLNVSGAGSGVIADIAGTILLETVTSGNVGISGAVTASGDAVTVNSAGAINGAGTITGEPVALNAETGIGNTTAVNLVTTTLDADTTSGAIAINNTAPGAVTVNNITTGSGSITYNQTGGASALLTLVKTTNGDITISNTGTGADIDIGLVMADLVNDTASITASGAINSVTNDGVADVVAETVTLVASSIGTTSELDVTAGSATLNADTSSAGGDIEIDHIGDAQIGLITTGGSGNVILHAVGGDIDSATDDSTADIIANNVTLIADIGGIGNDSDLDVTVSGQLDADSTADGANIVIDSIGNLPVGFISTDGGGTIGTITLASTAGIFDHANDTVVDLKGSTLNFNAAGSIGTLANPLETNTTNVSLTGNGGDVFLDNSIVTDTTTLNISGGTGFGAFRTVFGGNANVSGNPLVANGIALIAPGNLNVSSGFNVGAGFAPGVSGDPAIVNFLVANNINDGNGTSNPNAAFISGGNLNVNIGSQTGGQRYLQFRGDSITLSGTSSAPNMVIQLVPAIPLNTIGLEAATIGSQGTNITVLDHFNFSGTTIVLGNNGPNNIVVGTNGPVDVGSKNVLFLTDGEVIGATQLTGTGVISVETSLATDDEEFEQVTVTEIAPPSSLQQSSDELEEIAPGDIGAAGASGGNNLIGVQNGGVNTTNPRCL